MCSVLCIHFNDVCTEQLPTGVCPIWNAVVELCAILWFFCLDAQISCWPHLSISVFKNDDRTWKCVPVLEKGLIVGLFRAFRALWYLKATQFCTIPWLCWSSWLPSPTGCASSPLLLAFYISANVSEFREGRINSKQIGFIFIVPFGHRIPVDISLNTGSTTLSNSF